MQARVSPRHSVHGPSEARLLARVLNARAASLGVIAEGCADSLPTGSLVQRPGTVSTANSLAPTGDGARDQAEPVLLGGSHAAAR